MKKLYTAVFLFVVSLVFVALWFSPLVFLGTPEAYGNNKSLAVLDGLCYPSDTLCRVDFSGNAEDMYTALDSICASVVDIAKIDGLTVVYAYSPRVCAKAQYLRSGACYNVMAAYSDGAVSIGTPILSGCY